MKKFIAVFILSFIFISITSFAQVIYTPKDSALVMDKFNIAKAKELYNKPIGTIIEQIGLSFIGTDYVAHTLETYGEEKLIINLTQLDCTTFLETTFALSRCIKEKKFTFADYVNMLKFIRYRNGELTDYTSRLHYTSDWIINNEEKGIVHNVTKKLGGIPFNKKFFIMSQNTDTYRALKDKPDLIEKIKQHEERLSNSNLYYIPTKNIKSIEKNIQTGDFIGLATSVDGVDLSHVGIAVKGKDNRIYFLHAPMSGKKVELTEVPLSEYIAKRKLTLGIVVFRPID